MTDNDGYFTNERYQNNHTGIQFRGNIRHGGIDGERDGYAKIQLKDAI